MDWNSVHEQLQELASQLRRESPFQADCLSALAELIDLRAKRREIKLLIIHHVRQIDRDVAGERIQLKNHEALDALRSMLGILRRCHRTEVQDIFGDEDEAEGEKDPPIGLTACHPLCTKEEIEWAEGLRDEPTAG